LMVYVEPPEGALNATANGIVSFWLAMVSPTRAVFGGHTHSPETQNFFVWKPQMITPVTSWTAARPDVETVTTSPSAALTSKTVWARLRSWPDRPAAVAWAGWRKTCRGVSYTHLRA